jgi:hypothetical protein
MAAGEEELQALVRKGGRFQLVLHRLWDLQQARLLDQGAVAADPVDRPPPGRRDQPVRRVRRDAVPRPPLRRGREGLLAGFLGEIEIAEEADQRGQDAPPLLPVDALEDR